MGLPKVERKSETVELPGGSSVDVRGLSRGEALELRELADAEGIGALEARMIAYATDTPAAEAAEWHRSAPSAVVDALVSAIARASGLDGELGKGTDGS